MAISSAIRFCTSCHADLKIISILSVQEVNNESRIPNGRSKSTEDGSKYGRMDLADFVSEVDKFSRLIEPIAFVVYCIEDIRK
jgi:hypothetical protein